jgi:hypothetical protein
MELSKAKVETFIACPHSSLQNFEPARVQIRAALQDIDISEIKAVAGEAISLDIQDAFIAGAEVRLRVRCEAAIEPVRAVINNVETHTAVHCTVSSTPAPDGWQDLSAGSLPVGTYRIRVDAEDVAEPISDLFLVVESKG